MNNLESSRALSQQRQIDEFEELQESLEKRILEDHNNIQEQSSDDTSSMHTDSLSAVASDLRREQEED